MTWLVGIDEAGYGPNLGPLAIGATAWNLPNWYADDHQHAPDLYQELTSAVSDAPDSTGRIPIADSKALYQPKGSLKSLERGLFAAIATQDEGSPGSWQSLKESLHIANGKEAADLPWQRDFDPRIPVDADGQILVSDRASLSAACEKAGITEIHIRASLIQPAEFNDLTSHYGTKGAALSHKTLELLSSLLKEILPADSATTSNGQPLAICMLDKHGGRNKYVALLQHHFPDEWIETSVEGRKESSYAWGPTDRRITASFRVGGESFLPTALASMTAKYLRELSMRAFNDYWANQVSGIKPTAGYPMDAKRFRLQIAEKQQALKIEDHILWRNR